MPRRTTRFNASQCVSALGRRLAATTLPWALLVLFLFKLLFQTVGPGSKGCEVVLDPPKLVFWQFVVHQKPIRLQTAKWTPLPIHAA
jgi:hypothetical protein